MKKMKKIALFSFAFAALSLASCKKERTCTCTGTTTVVSTTNGTSTTTTSPEAYTEVLAKATKGTAKGKKTCMSRTLTETNTYTSGGVTTEDKITQDFTCSIK